MVLAEERKASLLIDDRVGRRVAEKRGIPCFGSLRVLKEAKGRGLIPAVKPTLDALRQAGLHLSDALYRTFLLDAGE